MLPRITVPLLAAATIAFFACGPRMPNPAAQARSAARSASRAPSRAPSRSDAAKGVVSQIVVDTTRGAVRFALDVSNESPKRVELDFPSGLTHDFIVLDASGKEVWRWSAGRMFTQAMQNRLLDANDSATFSERWEGAVPGTYTLVAQLNSANYPVRQQVQFTLP
jgi:hypothetical protein